MRSVPVTGAALATLGFMSDEILIPPILDDPDTMPAAFEGKITERRFSSRHMTFVLVDGRVARYRWEGNERNRNRHVLESVTPG